MDMKNNHSKHDEITVDEMMRLRREKIFNFAMMLMKGKKPFSPS